MAHGNGERGIWTPDGIIGLTPRERVELKPGLVAWLAQFEDFAKHFSLGLHCSKCGADLVGKNSERDRVFSAVCQCREFVGRNRDWKTANALPLPRA